MAAGDYRSCDVCGGKTFYDANMWYYQGVEEGNDFSKVPYRIAGQQQFSNEEANAKYGLRLGRLGDWAVLCQECAKTHRAIIVPIEKEENETV